MDYGPSVLGLLVGIVVGATSTGGGALLTPALILVAGVPASIAIGSDVLIASGMKLFGGGVYALRGQVHWATVGRLAAGSLPGATVGVWLLNRLPAGALDAYLSRGVGIVLIAAGAAVIVRFTRGAQAHPRRAPRLPVTVALGFATGMLVSMTSVGSGSLLLCVLSLCYPLGAAAIVGTDLVHALLLSSVATVGHGLAGRVDVALAGTVLAGAVPGVLIGARFATAVPERTLRGCLAAMLIVIGLQLALFTARGETPRRTETGSASAWQGVRRAHIGYMQPTNNAVRRDATPGECSGGFRHGLSSASPAPAAAAPLVQEGNVS